MNEIAFYHTMFDRQGQASSLSERLGTIKIFKKRS